MAGNRPTRPQLRSRRRAINSYLLSTRSSYSDVASHFGVSEKSVRDFLNRDTKYVRAHYSQKPAFQKLYNTAAGYRHATDLRKLAKSHGKQFDFIPLQQYYAPYAGSERRLAQRLRVGSKERTEALIRAKTYQGYVRAVEADYNIRVRPRERQRIAFFRLQSEKGNPASLYDFIASEPDEGEIDDYINDVIEVYNLSGRAEEGFIARINALIGI